MRELRLRAPAPLVGALWARADAGKPIPIRAGDDAQRVVAQPVRPVPEAFPAAGPRSRLRSPFTVSAWGRMPPVPGADAQPRRPSALAALAASGYADYDASSGRFRLSPEQAFALTCEENPMFAPGGLQVAASTRRCLARRGGRHGARLPGVPLRAGTCIMHAWSPCRSETFPKRCGKPWPSALEREVNPCRRSCSP